MPRLGVRVPLSPPLLFFLRCSQTAHFVSVIPIFIANRSINNLLWAALTIFSDIHNSLVFPRKVWEHLWEQMRWRSRLEAIRGESEVTLRPWALFRRRGSVLVHWQDWEKELGSTHHYRWEAAGYRSGRVPGRIPRSGKEAIGRQPGRSRGRKRPGLGQT